MSQKIQFLEFLEQSLTRLNLHKELAIECNAKESIILLHEDFINHCIKVKKLVSKFELPRNYISQFNIDITLALNHFPYNISRRDVSIFK